MLIAPAFVGLDVFSMSVEVFPRIRGNSSSCYRLLHVRGGVSTTRLSELFDASSSPRPWRCFRNGRRFLRHGRVFSTSVEVFLEAAPSLIFVHSLLHVRGGVSKSGACPPRRLRSSPRPWRCF